MQFIDKAKIYIRSGRGGDGCLSFRREKFIEFGGPNGGDGGTGGNIILKGTKNFSTLIDFKYKQHYKAENGQNGKGNLMSGSAGKNLCIELPVGTIVFDENKESILFEIKNDTDEFLILKGGEKGFGNAHFKTSTNRAPRRITKGEASEEMIINLELRLIANVGLLGMPNSGKSTFLSIVSSAKPKIGNYPFTTLKPKLGIMKHKDTTLTIADIPGLIEGASKGVGLGIEFLNHVKKCEMMVHLIDISQNDIAKHYHIIRNELKSFDETLFAKTEIVVLNKIDLIQNKEELKKIVNNFKKATKLKEVGIVSTLTKENLENVMDTIINTFAKNKIDSKDDTKKQKTWSPI